MGRLRPAASRLIAFAETTWGAVTVFGIALAVWWIQAIAIPVGPGRDFETYVGDFVELFQRHPIDIGYVLGRTPIAPLVTGALLDFAHGALAEPGMSILYALSVTAWFLAARRFGAGAAVASTVVLLAYPSYGILFHDLASDSVFAAAFAGWSLLLVRATLVPSPARFAFVGGGVAVLVLVRPGNEALLVLVLLPLLAHPRWRDRLVSSVAFLVPPIALLGLWAVHNGALYGKYSVATGGNERLPFERTFLTERIVRPTNGPASRTLAGLVRRDLLNEEPYRAYGIHLADFFSDPSPRMIVDLEALSNRRFGWKSDSQILRQVGIEAVRTHVRAYSEGVATTVWDLLWEPVFRPLPAGPSSSAGATPSDMQGSAARSDTIVVDGRHLPKPSEGERIPAPHDEAPTTEDGGISTVWTSPTERHLVFLHPADRARLTSLHRRMEALSSNLPHEQGDETLALRLDQLSRWFPPPVVWLAVGILAMVLRRPSNARAAAMPAVAGLVVIVLSALAIAAVPQYSAPVAPAFALIGAVGLFGRRTSAA